MCLKKCFIATKVNIMYFEIHNRTKLTVKPLTGDGCLGLMTS